MASTIDEIKQLADAQANAYAQNAYNAFLTEYQSDNSATPLSVDDFNLKCYQYIIEKLDGVVDASLQSEYETYISATSTEGACSKGYATYSSLCNQDDGTDEDDSDSTSALDALKKLADAQADKYAQNAYELFSIELQTNKDATPLSTDDFNQKCYQYITSTLDNAVDPSLQSEYEKYISASSTSGACSKGYSTYLSLCNQDDDNDDNTTATTQTTKKTDGDATDNKKTNTNTKTDNSTGSVKVNLRELRSTPGFTNYVVGVEKTLSGGISSATLKRYYSSIDAEVYFNGYWVEDIEQIQWSISQETRPLFGYNSHLWDEVAQGARMISGSFAILFTKPDIMRTYTDASGKKSNTSSTNAQYNGTYEDTANYLKNNTVTISSNGGTLVSNTNYLHAPRWAKKFDIDVVCGEADETSKYPVHIILKDCYLTNCNTIRSKDGNPAAEVYQFMARDYETVE